MSPHPEAPVNTLISTGQRAKVHVNLHRRQLAVSVPPHGRVTAYVDDITLSDVEFRFQPACARRVRDRGVRAVCAYATGWVTATNTHPAPAGRKISYNPLRRPDFHDAITGERVDTAALVAFVDLRAYALDPDPEGLRP